MYYHTNVLIIFHIFFSYFIYWNFDIYRQFRYIYLFIYLFICLFIWFICLIIYLILFPLFDRHISVRALLYVCLVYFLF